MYSRNALKQKARTVLKSHYVLFVILLLAAAMLGTSFTSMVDLVKFSKNSEIGSTTTGVISSIISGNFGEAFDYVAGNRVSVESRSVKLWGLEIGHQEGVFSDIVNAYSSGSIFASIASILLTVTHSPTLVRILFALAALFVVAFKVIFISETYQIIYTRMFLEGRIYSRVDTSTLTYLIRTKHWMKVSLAFFRRNLYLALWCLTIIGGVIKHYSYAMVDFILAENPDISGRDAIDLSRRMMQGHKWELFCLDLSFIGWYILGALTGSILTVLYVAPYHQSTMSEYFVRLRDLCKDAGTPGIELLNDDYLYTQAPRSEIDKAYADIISIMESPEVELPQPSKLRAFFQNVFGVVLWYDEHEKQYREVMTRKADIDSYKYCVAGTEYPARLCPLGTEESRISFEHTHYMRHYSLTSLILIFFSFCLVGWLWEVSIHIVEDGVFVNRGVLHGPWLPIYGVGSLMILMCLAHFRKNPLVEFGSAVLLCGGVEYFGSWALEMTHDGQKWWDYTGYFLNINGRICAEGLLVFGLAGLAAVYFIAPLLDNFFSRFREAAKRRICIVLLIFFAADLIWSHYSPNTGEGITDYACVSTSSDRSC